MRDFIDSKILDVCFSTAVAVISILSQGELLSEMMSVGELLLFGIPPACCPYHEAGMITSATCQVSSKRVPKRGAYKRLLSAEASAAQDFQTLVNHMLRYYARNGVHAVLGHYYSTMLLLNLPGLFSTTLCNSETSRDYALNTIRKTALATATPAREPLYKDARMATSLIHSLLKPAQPDMSPATEDFVHLGNNNFRTGIQALLLQSCSEPFYTSTDNFLGPDEIASDIPLWLGGPSFNFADAQWRRMCMPVWVHIAKRALIPHYSSRPDWQNPSDHLQRNLCCLIACDRLCGIQSTIEGGSAGGGEQHTDRLNADGGDSDADFWSGDDV